MRPSLVDVTRGLDGGTMIEQAHGVLTEAAYGVGYYREESNAKGFVLVCVLAVCSSRL
jgi:hypothetical protein